MYRYMIDDMGYWQSSDGLVESNSVSFGAFESESDAIPVSVTITSEVFLMSTTAILHCNGEEIPMHAEGETFQVELVVPVFQEHTITDATFIGQNFKETARLYWTITPMNQVIPKFFSYYQGTTGPRWSGDNQVNYSGSLTFYMYDIPLQGAQIEQVNLIEILDGELRTQKQIDGPFSNLFNNAGSLSIDPKVKGAVPKGSTVEFVVEVVDGNGFLYRHVALRLSADGVSEWESNIETSIYNRNEELLFVI